MRGFAVDQHHGQIVGAGAEVDTGQLHFTGRQGRGR
jgi:hypothetical protein